MTDVPATAVAAPCTVAVAIVAIGGIGSHVNVTPIGPRTTSTVVECMANCTGPPVAVNDMSGTAKLVVAGKAFPEGSTSSGPIDSGMPSAVFVPSRVFDAETVTLAVPDGVSPGFSSPRPMPVCSTDAGTVTFHDWLRSTAAEPAAIGDVVCPLASNSSSLRSGVTLLVQDVGYDAVPALPDPLLGGGAVATVVLGPGDVVGVVVVDGTVEEVESLLASVVELLGEPPPLVANGWAATGFVPVQSGAGGSPHPAGVGVPGVHLKVTVMIPLATLALVSLPPRLSATVSLVAFHVEVGNVALTDNGVADSSPEFVTAGVGSEIVVVPVTSIGGSVCDGCSVPDPSSVRFTLPGMLFVPSVSKPSRYPATSVSAGTSILNVAPDSVIVSPATGEAGVNDPDKVTGKADVPGCALFVHEFVVVTVPAPAGSAPTDRTINVASHRGNATDAANRRRRSSGTGCLPSWLGHSVATTLSE